MGLDDFLAAGDSVDDLLALSTEHLHQSEPDPNAPAESPYRMSERGFEWRKQASDGPQWTPLGNFTTTITADVAHDDGVELRRIFEMQGAVKARASVVFTVPTPHFAGLGWVSKELGAAAFIAVGQMMREHTRAAIQLLSGDIPEQQVFTHTGWRSVGGAWVYLHAGDAIDATGAVPGMQTALSGALAGYQLPEPPCGADLIRAVRMSLATLSGAPDAATVPLLAAVYRAALGSADFSLFLAGGSGVGKSELAALMQQHFGAGLNREHLPANWSSTANALELQAFLAKDTLMVVDDFAPSGSAIDVARLHATAEGLLRNQGNGSGRGRMNADGTLRSARPPRGMTLSTGEDVPRGQSLRARMLILEVGRETVDFDALSNHQRAGANGAYAAAMTGFLQWLAVDFDGRQAILKARVAELRGHAWASRQHKRTPALIADLAAGWEVLLRYAQESGAITAAEYQNLWQRGWHALGEAAAAQTAHQTARDPVARYLELLGSALGSGIAHVESTEGSFPTPPRAWGWRRGATNEWRPLGSRIGWVSDDDLYLLSDGAFDAAQRAAGAGGEGLTIGAKTLSRRLHERGLLRS